MGWWALVEAVVELFLLLAVFNLQDRVRTLETQLKTTKPETK